MFAVEVGELIQISDKIKSVRICCLVFRYECVYTTTSPEMNDKFVTAVSAKQQQEQQQYGAIIATRLTPFSIDNILGKSRDIAPVHQAEVKDERRRFQA